MLIQSVAKMTSRFVHVAIRPLYSEYRTRDVFMWSSEDGSMDKLMGCHKCALPTLNDSMSEMLQEDSGINFDGTKHH